MAPSSTPPSGATRSTYRNRILKEARRLARSGRFASGREIIEFLVARQISETSWFSDARFLAQLDNICALAMYHAPADVAPVAEASPNDCATGQADVTSQTSNKSPP